MNTKIWTVVGVVAIIAIIGAFAWTQMDHTPAEREVFYDYDVVEVETYDASAGWSYQYSALVEFPDSLPGGVRAVAMYDGKVLDEYTPEADVSELRFWFNLPYVASEQSIKTGLTVQFFS